MAHYKEKYKQIVVNSAKCPSYFYKGDIAVFNLNSCFTKKNNYVKFLSAVKEALEKTNKINLCNLASLCYKLNIDYGSEECYEMISKIISLLKTEHPEVILLQNNIRCYGEIDLQPIHELIQYDRDLHDEFIKKELVPWVGMSDSKEEEDEEPIIHMEDEPYAKLEKNVPNNIIIINHVLMESLKYIGYVSTQIFDIFDFTKDFNEIVPKDIIATLPIDSEKNMEQYNKIRKLF